ncbi:hypothetical protein BGZ54_004558, partial [Gamsiella multidivaricata]
MFSPLTDLASLTDTRLDRLHLYGIVTRVMRPPFQCVNGDNHGITFKLASLTDPSVQRNCIYFASTKEGLPKVWAGSIFEVVNAK